MLKHRNAVHYTSLLIHKSRPRKASKITPHSQSSFRRCAQSLTLTCSSLARLRAHPCPRYKAQPLHCSHSRNRNPLTDQKTKSSLTSTFKSKTRRTGHLLRSPTELKSTRYPRCSPLLGLRSWLPPKTAKHQAQRVSVPQKTWSKSLAKPSNLDVSSTLSLTSRSAT